MDLDVIMALAPIKYLQSIGMFNEFEEYLRCQK